MKSTQEQTPLVLPILAWLLVISPFLMVILGYDYQESHLKAVFAAPKVESQPSSPITPETIFVKLLLSQNYHGDVYDAGNWRWVRVVNPNPITQQSASGKFYRYLIFGDYCGVGRDLDSGLKGGKLTVRGKNAYGTLVEYTTEQPSTGTPCPSKVLFFEGSN